MDGEIKSRWITLLRSGVVSQGRGQLRQRDRYDPMGVLCLVMGYPISQDGCVVVFGGEETYTPIRNLLTDKQLDELTYKNDVEKLKFPELANWIEQNI